MNEPMPTPTVSPAPKAYRHEHLACVHGCLLHIGVRVTPGWLFGVTGQAFAPGALDDHGRPPSFAAPSVRLLGARLDVLSPLGPEPTDESWRAHVDAVHAVQSRGGACYVGDIPGERFHCIVQCGPKPVSYVVSAVGGRSTWIWSDAGPRYRVVCITSAPCFDDVDAIRSGLQTGLDAALLARERGWPGEPGEIRAVTHGDERAGRRLMDHLADLAERRAYAVEFMWEAKERLRGRQAPLFNAAAEHYDRVTQGVLAAQRAGFDTPAAVRAATLALADAFEADALAMDAMRDLVENL